MKKIILAILISGMMVAAATGCSGKEKSNTVAESTISTEIPADAMELKGTVDELKDSMFVIEATDGKYYAFNFGEKVYVSKDDLKQGEKVKLFYSGELSEVDAFTGTVYKVETIK